MQGLNKLKKRKEKEITGIGHEQTEERKCGGGGVGLVIYIFIIK